MSVGPSALGQADVPANGRIHLDPSEQDLQLASSNDIHLHIESDPVLEVIVSWKDAHGATPAGSEEKLGMLNFGADGQAVIPVHPPTLGHATLSIRVDFSDGRYALAETDVNVALPKRKAKTFEVTDGHDSEKISTLQMDLDQNRVKRLAGLATYSGYKPGVSIDAASLKFVVKPLSGQPAIDVDPRTGLVTAHAEGQALVDVRFAGQDRKVCVVVSKDADAPSAASCSNGSK